MYNLIHSSNVKLNAHDMFERTTPSHQGRLIWLKPSLRRQSVHSFRYPLVTLSPSGKASPSVSLGISSRWQGRRRGWSSSSTRLIPYAVVDTRGGMIRPAGSRRSSSHKWMEWVGRREVYWSWERPTSHGS